MGVQGSILDHLHGGPFPFSLARFDHKSTFVGEVPNAFAICLCRWLFWLLFFSPREIGILRALRLLDERVNEFIRRRESARAHKKESQVKRMWFIASLAQSLLLSFEWN